MDFRNVPSSTGSVTQCTKFDWLACTKYQTLLAQSVQTHQFGPVTQSTKLCWLHHSNPVNLVQPHKVSNSAGSVIPVPSIWSRHTKDETLLALSFQPHQFGPVTQGTKLLTCGCGSATLAGFAGQLVVASQTHSQGPRRLLGKQPAFGGAGAAGHDTTVPTVVLETREIGSVLVTNGLYAAVQQSWKYASISLSGKRELGPADSAYTYLSVAKCGGGSFTGYRPTCLLMSTDSEPCGAHVYLLLDEHELRPFTANMQFAC